MAAIDTVASLVKVPTHSDRVHKEECVYCFKNTFTDGGVYVNLKSWQSFCPDHVQLDLARAAPAAYLNIIARKVPKPSATDEAAPTELAIGTAGGFDVNKKNYDVESQSAVVVLPEGARYELPCPELPEPVLTAVVAVQAHNTASKEDELAAWQQDKRVSKYALDLEQRPADRKISMNPSDWKCDETGVIENLWLNLHTGFIGSGRQHWDGSGGNGSALRHYEDMKRQGKKYPVVVKLGTITPAGADVYSYAESEDEEVLDPELDKHLKHWGIDMSKMSKTEKTMAELQIEKNLEYEFDKITEAGSSLQKITGPGYTGLTNLGNSCYMNSVLQVLWSIPELRSRFVQSAATVYNSAPSDVASDFLTQFVKVGVALVDGCEASQGGEGETEENAVKPHMLKSVIGKGHAEFASSRQQDAEEFFSYLLETLARAERTAGERGLDESESMRRLFEFKTVTRTQCSESKKVSYKPEIATALGLQIPVDQAVNKDELIAYEEREQKRQRMVAAGDAQVEEKSQEKVIPRVPLSACLQKYVEERTIEGYYSAALQRETQAVQRVGFGSLPPYLVVQLRRYYYDETYQPKKLEVLVDMPDHLSLEALRESGPKEGEELQPEADRPQKQLADSAIVQQLVGMGFSENGSKRAAIATGNSSAEAAMEWVFTHMEDADFNDPIVEEKKGAGGFTPDSDSLAMLTSMGFTARQATAALQACQGSVERAADWLFSRADDLDAAVEATLASSESKSQPASEGKIIDGPGEYELVGFISHIGGNTACGHYVCHLKKDNKWVIFNDEKVALSDNPPLDLGYIYLYRRSA